MLHPHQPATTRSTSLLQRLIKFKKWCHRGLILCKSSLFNHYYDVVVGRNYADSLSSYTDEQMRQVSIAHRQAKDWADWVALGAVRVMRWGMDTVTGYRHPAPGQEVAPKFKMSEKKWLTRFIFLESVAGVPGMVGGMLRHLRSLRKMKRDNGW